MGETTNHEAELIDKIQEFKLRKTYPQKLSGDISNRKLGTGSHKEEPAGNTGCETHKKALFHGDSISVWEDEKGLEVDGGDGWTTT